MKLPAVTPGQNQNLPWARPKLLLAITVSNKMETHWEAKPQLSSWASPRQGLPWWSWRAVAKSTPEDPSSIYVRSPPHPQHLENSQDAQLLLFRT